MWNYSGPCEGAAFPTLDMWKKHDADNDPHLTDETKKSKKASKTRESPKEAEVQIQRTNILMSEKGKLNAELYHMQCAARNFEGESTDLASHLQYSQQRVGELDWTLCCLDAAEEHGQV
ncbi:golgin subfamily A member 8S-like isoform X1 [Macaca mulatta]